MSNQRIHQDLLDLADYAYGRLRARLEGLTDEEYFAEPAPYCWSVRPVGDGTFRADGTPVPAKPAPFTTVAWRMSHLINVLAGERNATWIGVTPTGGLDRDGDPGTAAMAIDQLERAFALFRKHVAAADPEQLLTAMGPIAGPYAESTRAAFVLHEVDELIHHGAEIGVLRDLYRATAATEPIVEAALKVDRQAVEALLAAEPDLRERHRDLVARMAGMQHWNAVRLLVELGFDAGTPADGTTALHYAAGAGETSIVRLLIGHGADTAVTDPQFGADALGWARYFGRDEVAGYLEGR